MCIQFWNNQIKMFLYITSIRLRDDYVMYRQAVKDSQSVNENIVGKQQQPIKSDWAQ